MPPELSHLANVVAGRTALEVKAQNLGLDHAPANEAPGSQTRMSEKEVEHWANKTAGGGAGVTRGSDYSTARAARKDIE